MKRGQDRRLRTIVFSDVVDSSVKIFADELIAIQQIKNDLALIREHLQSHNGSLVKSLGDGLLMTFDAPSQALDFIQVVISRLSSRKQQSLSHRFGLHTGEIYADGDDILGQGVHLASRLQTVSPVNGVAFVRSTYELIDASYRRLATRQGEVELKGLPEPMEVFTLSADQLVGSIQEVPEEACNLSALLEETSYVIERPMGRSQHPQTWLLREPQRDRQAVLKLIPAEDQLVEALQLEAATLDRLRHPRIPRILDAFERSGLFCLIQEYIPGASLHGSMDLLRRKQRIGELLRQQLVLLEVVHAAGLVHGDIHPANLIPDSDGTALFLVDFSLLRARVDARRALGGSSGASLSEMGRPYFSAPERARFGRLTPAADLYALGLTALTLYTGQSPDVLYDLSRGSWSFDELDPEVAHWLEPLLQESPAQRLQKAADALRLLDQPLATGVVPDSVPVSAPFQAGVSKEQLQGRLIAIYGPMVDLLLEAQPSHIPADQVAALVGRLVGAGLREDDVNQAIAAAAPQGNPSVPKPALGSQLEMGDPRQLLKQVIGPIADLLWTEEMSVAWRQGPDQLRPLLEQAGVARESIDDFLAQIDGLQQAPSVAVKEVALADDLKRQLIELVGPIGEQLFAEVHHLPAQQRRLQLVERLRSFGVAEEVLRDLR